MEKGEIRFHGPTAELLERPDVLRSVFLERRSSAAVPATGDGHRTGAPTERDRGAARRAPGDGAACSHCETCRASTSVASAASGPSTTCSLARRARRDPRHHRPERRRQDDALRPHLRVHARSTPAGSCSAARDVTDQWPPRPGPPGLGRSFQDARLFPSLTVRGGASPSPSSAGSTVRDPSAPRCTCRTSYDAERKVARAVDELIELLGPRRVPSKFVRELSTGTRRVVDLACLLAHRPSVILLDEPSSGIAQREAEALGPCCCASGRDRRQPRRHRARHAAPRRASPTGSSPWTRAPSSPTAHPTTCSTTRSSSSPTSGTDETAIDRSDQHLQLTAPDTPGGHAHATEQRPAHRPEGGSALRRWGPHRRHRGRDRRHRRSRRDAAAGTTTTPPAPATTRPRPRTAPPGPPTAPNGPRVRSAGPRPRRRTSTSRSPRRATPRPAGSPSRTSSHRSASPTSTTTAAPPRRGVTADSITVVVYFAPDADPVLDFITVGHRQRRHPGPGRGHRPGVSSSCSAATTRRTDAPWTYGSWRPAAARPTRSQPGPTPSAPSRSTSPSPPSAVRSSPLRGPTRWLRPASCASPAARWGTSSSAPIERRTSSTSAWPGTRPTSTPPSGCPSA